MATEIAESPSSDFKATYPDVHPLGDRILIQPFPKASKSKGGIVLPESTQEKQTRGVVVAVGPGLVEAGTRVPPAVNCGEHVLYERYAGVEIEVNDIEYKLMGEDSVLARLGPQAQLESHAE